MNALPSIEQKCAKVFDKNTFYFFDSAEQDKHEGYIHALREILTRLKAEVETCRNEEEKRQAFDHMLATREHGLRALLALTGFSNESFKRLITVARIRDDEEFDRVINKASWLRPADRFGPDGGEWGSNKVAGLIQENPEFRRGVVNLFFEGASVQFLARTLPTFELRKFSLGKLNFEPGEMLDTLVRYKEKGPHAARSDNNPETVIGRVIKACSLTFDQGDLPELAAAAPRGKRSMDFIIPDRRAPKLVVECSYLATTSSGQGDKAKTERSIRDLIKRHYPGCMFVGFVDGIGWTVRASDLARMVDAFDDVFTLHADELARFAELLNTIKGGMR